jgi:hypothetical protein
MASVASDDQSTPACRAIFEHGVNRSLVFTEVCESLAPLEVFI